LLIDSHCHLDRLDLSPYGGSLAAALNAARHRGVKRFLCIGIGRKNASQVIEISEKNEDVYATVGLHPLEFSVSEFNERETLGDTEIRSWLRSMGRHPKIVGIGETGLDYYYSRDDITAQRNSFIAHLETARELGKPVIVHTRDAGEDTIRLIREHGCPQKVGVLHCFTESWEVAKGALDLGYYISFSGIITFKNADKLREIAAKIPEDRLLIETDAPYLAPMPYRGKKNEPQYVKEVADCLANLRNVSLGHLGETTSVNFSRLFGVPISEY
jgi:TatD DNase family protein